jgi:HSP20 family protein
MTFSNLIPWSKKFVPVNREESRQTHPVHFLHDDMNRLFDEFFHRYETAFSSLGDFGTLATRGTVSGTISTNFPRMDVRETENELRITAEVPGLSENDVQVSLSADSLTLSGEKKEEKIDNEKGWYRMERQYGSFTRVIPLPCEIEQEKAEAVFKNGVLTVILPKLQESKKARTINVKKE